MRSTALSWRIMLTGGDYPLGGSLENAFWRTICADLLYVPKDGAGRAFQRSTAVQRSTTEGLFSYLNWQSEGGNDWRRTTIIDGCIQEPVAGDGKIEDKNAFHYAVETASESRKFFMTSEGYVGIGPDLLVPGDDVYILLGSRVPLILRKARPAHICHNEELKVLISAGEDLKETQCFQHHRTFTLVGDAYVHGIMDGEAISSKSREKVPEPIFLE
jgi:hypothetical protein